MEDITYKQLEHMAEQRALAEYLSDWDYALSYDEILEVIRSGKTGYDDNGDPIVVVWDAVEERHASDLIGLIDGLKYQFVWFGQDIIQKVGGNPPKATL